MSEPNPLSSSAVAPGAAPPGPGPILPGTEGPPRGRPFPTLVLASVTVGVIAFVAGIVAGTTIHSSSSSSSSSASPAWTYDQAKSVSEALANGRGGNWQESVSLGIASPGAEIYPPTGIAGCVVPGFYIPAYDGSLASGVAPVWLFVYLQDPSSFAPAELATVVENGSAHVLVQYPQGTACTSSLNATDVISGAVVNSPVAASNASQSASAYLEAESGVTAVFELEAGAPANWTVGYSPCSVVPGATNESGVQPTEVLTLTGASGAITGTRPSTATCVSKRPYVIDLSQGPSGSLIDGAYYDNFSVTITAPLPVEYLAAAVVTAHGALVYAAPEGCLQTNFGDCPDPSFGWYLVVSSSGTVQETFAEPSAPGDWTPSSGSATTDLESGETLSVVSSTSISGTQDVLGLLGVGGPTVVSQTTL